MECWLEMRVVRLCKTAYPPLDGTGASRIGGRWNSPGKPVVYTASCGALAALEYLVHVGTMLPPALRLVIVEIPDTVPKEIAGWVPPDEVASRVIGDNWVDRGHSAVLEVPSVLVPKQKNYLLNPMHPSFGAIKIEEQTLFAFDSRLLAAMMATA
jgi:RES domain-containing protein